MLRPVRLSCMFYLSLSTVLPDVPLVIAWNNENSLHLNYPFYIKDIKPEMTLYKFIQILSNYYYYYYYCNLKMLFIVRLTKPAAVPGSNMSSL
jgi:hypothetical protein